MRHIGLAFLAWAVAATLVHAEVPSLRPMPRPDVMAPAVPIATAPAAATLIRPKPRPVVMSDPAAPALPPVEAAPDATFAGPLGPTRSIRPPPRADLSVASTAAPKKGLLATIFGGKSQPTPVPSVPGIKKGSVCGDPAIRGEAIARISGRVKGCGIDEPVRVSEVDGVRLSTAATLDCETARALRTWVSKGLKPAFDKAEVTELRVVAHYACRTRNNRSGERISEHGRGKAIDIAGITLATGEEISVIRDFRRGEGAEMRRAHKAACGIFGTTLGPGSDRFHNDHMHFDTAKYRGGSYCK